MHLKFLYQFINCKQILFSDISSFLYLANHTFHVLFGQKRIYYCIKELTEYHVAFKKILKDENLISATYNPEYSGILGSVCFNIFTQTVEDGVISDYENKEYPDYYFHAITALKEIANGDTIPDEKLIIWY